VFIRNQSPLKDRVDLGAKNHMRTITMKKKYIVNYTAIGGGNIEVEAHSIKEAEELFLNITNMEFIEATDWGDGHLIEFMEIEDGDQHFEFNHGEYQGDDYEDRGEDAEEGEDEKETDLQDNEDDEGEVI
jgi:hypothetical protein